MGEWLKPHASKACIRGTVSGVRIPLSPPLSARAFRCGHFLPSPDSQHDAGREAYPMVVVGFGDGMQPGIYVIEIEDAQGEGLVKFEVQTAAHRSRSASAFVVLGTAIGFASAGRTKA